MILLIDSYDSFSNNLRALIQKNTSQEVVTIFNDSFEPQEYEHAFESWIKYFDFLVIGPGPGHPSKPEDIGIIGWLFQRFKQNPQDAIPTLGVCLGFQSLCHEFGNPVTCLESIKHGQIYPIEPVASELFGDDLEPFPSVRYHSLHVGYETLNSNIVPLATCSESELGDRRILMAGRHKELPLYGVQYHPESVCSSLGDKLVQRFEKIASAYNDSQRSQIAGKQHELRDNNCLMLEAKAVHEEHLVPDGSFSSERTPHLFAQKFTVKAADATAIDVCDFLAKQSKDFVLLNSAADPGQWSVIGLPIAGHTEVVTHSIDSPNKIVCSKYKDTDFEVTEDSIWKFLGSRMNDHYVPRRKLEELTTGLSERPFPFFGGYIGMLSYEEGRHLNSVDYVSLCEGDTPDTKLMFIERFVLYDRVSGNWFMVSIKEGDESFCTSFMNELSNASDLKIDKDSVPTSVKFLCKENDRDIRYEFPDRDIYKAQFGRCQEILHSGDSYELCLTTQSKIYLPSYLNTWDIYKVLALHKNPSPYSSYIDFSDCVLISSSPERFLSWKDSESSPEQKVAELRPIKGTVKNTDSVTLEDATKLLRTPKEMGENLMIVDLIRHDLQNFTEDVSVDALMAVEEYKTVYQLVSVIRGLLPKQGFKGIDVLHSSLPPGSMTGAPKKRSIELLQQIEALQPTISSGGRRGLYSGVAGYWSITDDADWSVIIRSMVHYKQDRENTSEKTLWRIGAGGAITVLSEEAAEWDEMQLKLSSTLQTFL